jgi:hypothetical protein
MHQFLLTIQVSPNSTLQLNSALAQNIGQIFQIIACCDTKSAYKVLGRGFHIPIVIGIEILFWSAKVGVGRDGGCAFKAL